MKLFSVITLYIFFSLGLFVLIDLHEQTHKSIFEHYNVSSTISYLPPRTIPDESIYTLSPEDTKRLREMQSWVDIIGYHFTGFYVAIFLLIFSYLMVKYDEEG
ncbi:MAG: hypothetical protein QXG39_00290 [Candidatus Aenigmatarchaeota archaeon]